MEKLLHWTIAQQAGDKDALEKLENQIQKLLINYLVVQMKQL